MSPEEFRAARHALAKRWGLDSPLTLDEMGRCLKLKGRMLGASVRDYERGKTAITGPMEVAIAGLLALDEPPEYAEIFEDDLPPEYEVVTPRRDYNDAELAMIRDGRPEDAKVAWTNRKSER